MNAQAEIPVDLSIVIPAYNEEQRLLPTLKQVSSYLKQRQITAEILVVDDGSSDSTAEVVVKSAAELGNIHLLSYQPNKGKGFAVRLGARRSKGRLVLFDDADGATPIEEVERLEQALAAGADVAIGSRALISAETHVKALWYRRLLGRTFNAVVNLLMVPGIADTQCGFKLFTRKAAEKLFLLQRAERFSFDVELLFLANKAGFKIAEVPVNWHNVAGSKVNLVVDSAKMFLDMFRFRWWWLTGVYTSGVDPEAGLSRISST